MLRKKRGEALGSHKSLASVTLGIVQLTLATSSLASGTDLTAMARNEEESDRSNRWAHRELGSGGLCSLLEKPLSLRSPACLSHRADQGGMVIAYS